MKVMQILNSISTDVSEVVRNNFPSDGNVNKMIKSGSGGNMINVTQMGCCVGQQSLWNKRIEIGYTERTLSFFKNKDLSPEAKGFIRSSYFDGLKPSEFFFGAMTGRDSMMDTALRTPKSGYLYRRLVNALQDLKAEYDGTIRDASENIVQFIYGEDGRDVSKLHLKDDKIVPGEAAGIITAQSFGEAATQMVLNVFHHAGVSHMQITLGLPRLIEILDARKNPSTPIMEVYLDKENNNEKNARIVAEKIREVKLGELASEINTDFGNKKIEISLSPTSLKNVHITSQKVFDRIEDKKYKIKIDGNKITISLPESEFKEIYKIREKLKDTIVSGVRGVGQVVISKKDRDFVIYTTGSNLKDVLEIKGVNQNKTTSNDIHDIKNVFGIEVARGAVLVEINKVLETQGLDINERHLSLLADAMTASGSFKGVTRMGIITEKSSVLAKASFETTIKQFTNATIQGKKDELNSVIENILLNQPIPVGTGLPGLLVRVTGPLADDKKESKKV